MKQLCIFPIPGCVTFPGTVFPLHVFEPRYRSMLQHCLDTGTDLAVCHTEKKISQGRETDSMEEALKSNRSTYKPYSIVSGGRCELIEVTDDGRMYLNVHVDSRYRIVSDVQTLPFVISECEEYPDTEVTDDEHAANLILKDKIMHRLTALAKDNQVIPDLLSSDEWRAKAPETFSFELFGLIGFDPEIMQELLELPSAHARLSMTLDLLNQTI